MTGGAGFIGRYMSRVLLRREHKVRILDDSHNDELHHICDYRQGNILDKTGLRDAIRDIDLVIHLAAKHRFFGVSERDFFLVNEVGTKNVLQAMDTQGKRKIIFFSTVAVYGDSDGPTNEFTVPKANTPYGLSKLAAERWVEKWAAEDERRTAIIIRPTIVFGPHNKGNIYRLIRQIYHRAYVPIGNGVNIKSIAYIDNVVAATLFLMNKGITGFEIFNYSDSPHMPYREIVDIIYSELKRKSPNYHLPLSPMLLTGRVLDKIMPKIGIDFSIETAMWKINKQTLHSADKIRNLGFSHTLSSEEGLRKMVKWYLENKRVS